MHGFQLWANLPSSLKMTAPRYQDIKSADIPVVVDDDGTVVRVISGEFWARPACRRHCRRTGLSRHLGSGRQAQTLPGRYLPPGLCLHLRRIGQLPRRLPSLWCQGRKGVPGRGIEHPRPFRKPHARCLRHGRRNYGAGRGRRHPFPSGIGQPIREPVAWHGPIVMNTREELMQAMRELQNGTFIKAEH